MSLYYCELGFYIPAYSLFLDYAINSLVERIDKSMDENSNIININKQVDDHEIRIRSLELNHMELKTSYLNIEKNMTELKLMVTENNQQLNKQLSTLLNKFVNSELNTKKINNENGWSLVFKVWLVLAPIVAGVGSYFLGR